MAEKSIGHLIEVTKQENAESRGVTKEVASEVSALTKMFGKYFKDLKKQAGDKLEEEREKKTATATASPLPDLSNLMKDTKDLGFLGMIAAITAGVSGMVAGVVKGFTDAVKLFLGPVGRLISKPFRIIAEDFGPEIKKLTDGIKKSFTNSITKFKTSVKGISTAFNLGTNNLNSGIKDIDGRFRKLTGLEKVAKSLGSGLASIKKFLSPIGKVFTSIAVGIRFIGSNLKSVFQPFFTWGEDIKKLGGMIGGQGKQSAGIISRIGEIFKSFKGVFSGFFTIFKTLGRVIFFPITVITTMVDAFKGFKEGFAADGIIGGVLGAISGVLQGLIGMPLDLIKNIVGWIAGKFGMEGVQEFLAGFSFTEMIGGLFNSIADSLFGMFDAMKDESGKFNFGKIVKVLVGGLLNTITSPIRMILDGIASVLDKIPLMGGAADTVRAASNALKIDTGVDAAIGKREDIREERDLQSANKEQSSDRIDEGRKEALASESKATGAPIAFQNINAPTTTNNSSNTALIGDSVPATDPLDKVYRMGAAF